MNAVVIPDPREICVRHAPLVPGIPREVILDFNATWCESYFRLSGDANHDIHSRDGAGIVQGTGILTLIGTAVSEHMLGYVLGGFDKVRYRNPVKIGNQVRMTMVRLGCKDRAPLVEVDLELMSGLRAAKATVLLVRKPT
ncbi:MAG: MaoC/PaaZ C-terminal domain-containing protein [Candidatus Kaiserbacteria bacterium]|nr:MaoC/PaaZ C-terminal domain-containing protein [Candidatus Kaiserbacteria bacterium]